MTLTSNKDGERASKWESFRSYSPNSYSVIDKTGLKVGHFSQILDVEFSPTKPVWAGMGRTFWRLREVREFVAGLERA